MYLEMKVERLIVLCYETVLRFKEILENIFLPKYALIIIFVISSTKRIFCNLYDLQKLQTVCVTNMAWTAFSGD